jgi:hypothetical protein
MDLSEEAEECASFYAKMLDHEYTSKTVFNKNFLEDWRKVDFFIVYTFILNKFCFIYNLHMYS